MEVGIAVVVGPKAANLSRCSCLHSRLSVLGTSSNAARQPLFCCSGSTRIYQVRTKLDFCFVFDGARPRTKIEQTDGASGIVHLQVQGRAAAQALAALAICAILLAVRGRYGSPSLPLFGAAPSSLISIPYLWVVP